jgi:hypothetical protein
VPERLRDELYCLISCSMGRCDMPKPIKSPNRIVAFLSDAQLKGLKLISEETAAPISALVRKAIDLFLAERDGTTKRKGK